MASLVVALFLFPAVTGSILSRDHEFPLHREDVQWVQPGDAVPSKLLRLVLEAAERKAVRGGPQGLSPTKVRTDHPVFLSTKSSAGQAGSKANGKIVEQLEEWKDHNLAVLSQRHHDNAKEILKPIGAKEYESLLKAFVGSAETRFVYAKGNQRAQQFIMKHMQDSGLDVKRQDFTMRMSEYGSKMTNIIGELKGTTKPEEFVVLGAHYDSIPRSGPAPGADDNGSGVASMLIAAAALAKSGVKFERSVRFVAFTAEEIGLVGSTEFVRQLSAAERKNFKGAVILDEVSYNKKHDHKPNVIFETSGRDTAQQVLIDTMAHTTRLIPGWGNSAKFLVNYAGWGSDHMPFLDAGLPAVLLIERDNLYAADNFGHTPHDDLSNIDYEFGASSASIATATIANLAKPVES